MRGVEKTTDVAYLSLISQINEHHRLQSDLQAQQSAATESVMFDGYRFGISSRYLSQNSSERDTRQGQLCLDPTQATLVIRPRAGSASANRKSPLAPKQGLGGGLVNSRGQHQSPITGTYALGTPRGKIITIACDSCRMRKRKVRRSGKGLEDLTNIGTSVMV